MVSTINPLSNISSLKLGDDEVKIIKPIYDLEIGEIKGLEETFFNYGYDEKNSKVLYSY